MKRTVKRTKSHMWTKDDIKEVIRLWDDATLEQIAERINVPKYKIQWMAKQIRKAGHDLPLKRKNLNTQLLIKEVLRDLR